MHYVSNRNLVDCAVIKLEGNGDYYFKVNTEDIMNASLLIKNILDSFNINYGRIYLTGFALVNKSEIQSLDRLSESVLRIANSAKTNTEEVKVSKR